MAKLKPDVKKIISGHECQIWINGRELGEAKAINAKVEFAKEEINCIGEFFTQHKITGGSFKGSVTEMKANSYQLKELEPYVNQRMPYPEATIMFNQTNEYGKEERVCLTGVIFDDLSVMNMEAGSPQEIEMPFTATGLEVIATFE